MNRRAQQPARTSVRSQVQKRTAELQAMGMEAKRASEQAEAEGRNGLLDIGGCCLVEDDDNHNHERRNQQGV
jgi:hypothetical protein